MTAIHLDLLDNQRREVLNRLEKFKDEMVLGGGTALALQVGHRKSYDFDLLVFAPIADKVWRKAKQVLGPGCMKTLDTIDQLSLVTRENVAVTFLYEEHPLLFPALETTYTKLARPKDIAVMKAYTVGRRGKWRDYVDLYFLLKDHISLPEIVELAERRYGGDFSRRQFLEQLVYFKDLDNFAVEFAGNPIEPGQIQVFLEEQVSKYTTENIQS